ncbi:hypothetical protein GCM10029978_106810 [Actinoallomurus acanthiterrae]
MPGLPDPRRLHKAVGRPYPPVNSLVRQILGWEKGEHFPRDWTAAYATAFGVTEVELFGLSSHLGLAGSGDGGAPSEAREVDPTKRRDALRSSRGASCTSGPPGCPNCSPGSLTTSATR